MVICIQYLPCLIYNLWGYYEKVILYILKNSLYKRTNKGILMKLAPDLMLSC